MKEFAQEEVVVARSHMEQLEKDLQMMLLPKDPNDERNIFLEIRAGTGGDESALFAGDLLRMYTRFAERMRWQVEMVSASESEIGGYKEVIVRIVGHGAYSRLKFESGGHRVQRVPSTETQGRIHTSACTVAIMPEADEVADVNINPADLRIDTYRASGAGGQHINKTDSAVRITHAPTGIVVQCQSDRSQHRNRAEAMSMLKARLFELEMRKRNEEKQAMEDSKTDIGWGHQIRSYVLDQSRIKDLRTNVETGNTQSVLDGDLDEFISASLKQGV
jgi:peptide chain release factor 1